MLSKNQLSITQVSFIWRRSVTIHPVIDERSNRKKRESGTYPPYALRHASANTPDRQYDEVGLATSGRISRDDGCPSPPLAMQRAACASTVHQNRGVSFGDEPQKVPVGRNTNDAPNYEERDNAHQK